MSKGSKGNGKPTAQAKSKKDQFVGEKKNSSMLYIVIAVVAIAAIGISLMMQGKNNSTVAQATPEEQKYLGVYLPEGYEAPKLTEAIAYDSTIKMSPVTPEVKDGMVEIPVGEVISKRIVYFEYNRPSDGQLVSMMAYMRPSGEVFVGVSYCPPCQGKYHRLEADGTLTCESCGTKRDPESQVGISGACKLYPADEMPAKVTGDKLQVAEADLAKWVAQPLDRQVGGN